MGLSDLSSVSGQNDAHTQLGHACATHDGYEFLTNADRSLGV